MYSHDILRPAVPQWQGIGCKVGGKAEGVSEMKVYKTAKVGMYCTYNKGFISMIKIDSVLLLSC